MAVLQAGNISDLVFATLKELGELRFSQIATALQRYVVMSRLMKKNKVQFFSAGYGIQWDVMTADNGSARTVGLYATDQVSVPSVLTQGNIDWRHVTWNWAVDRREIAMNSSPRRIVELIKTRRIASFLAAVKLFEAMAWSCPAATNSVDPYGIPYWICKSNTEGFYGTTPVIGGYTTVGGIDPTKYPVSNGYRWANWTNQYTSITKDDLIVKWGKAADFTFFEQPVESPTFNTGDDCLYATTYNVYSAMKWLLEAQNENLGYDVDAMDGKPVFRRSPIVWIPQLDADTTDPIYGVNFGELHTAGLRQEWLRETQIAIQPNQHTVSSTHTDCSFQWLTRDRRRHFVLAKNTTTPIMTPS
jgi:hypothetical protein